MVPREMRPIGFPLGDHPVWINRAVPNAMKLSFNLLVGKVLL